MTNNSTVFMAFNKAVEVKESKGFKLYQGIAPVRVLAVNPSKVELEKLYGTELSKEPNYDGEYEGVKTKRIDFIIETLSSDKCLVEDNVVTKVSFNLYNQLRYNGDKTKVEVINLYGETAWIPVEDAKSGKTPDNMKWYDTTEMHPMYRGEAELTTFIRALLNISNRQFKNKNTGNWENIKDITMAEGNLSKVKDYFKNDLSELKDCIKLAPENRVLVAFGVRVTDDNKSYQTVYNGRVSTFRGSLSPSTGEWIMKDIDERKANGGLKNEEFSPNLLTEWTIKPSDVAAEMAKQPADDTSDLPW